MFRCDLISDRLGWGVLGAAWITDAAMAGAIAASRNGRLVAIGARDRGRAESLATKHGIPRVHGSYDEVLADPAVEAVYNPLVNSLHEHWTLRALAAGKHVLCEKPLALDAGEAERMAGAAQAGGLLLMEAFMYRFHPRMRRIVEGVRRPRLVQAGFGFPLSDATNYRMSPSLGGGALLDAGCYVVNVARWILGEPATVAATGSGLPVDRTVAIALGFSGGAQASLSASFDTAEHEELTVAGADDVVRVSKPFTAYLDPDDPYQVMVEEFGDAVLNGTAAPLSMADSIAGMRVLDRVRDAIRRGRPS